MNVEEEVILWVTSELGPASAAVSEEQSGASDAIPVTLIGQSDEHLVQTEVNTVHFDDVKENYTIVEEDPLATTKKPRKRGFVWNYFIPTVPDRAQCTFCSADISYKGKSTNNLLRHLRTKHEEITKDGTFEAKIESCTTEDGSTYYVLSAPAEQPPSPTRSDSSFQEANSESESYNPFKRRGGVWKYFTANSKQKAKCKLCSTVISFKGGSTTNLLRHMKSKHVGVKVPHKLAKSSSHSEDSQSRVSIQHSLQEIVNECIKSDDENDFTGANQLSFDPEDEEMDVEDIVTLPAMDSGFLPKTEPQSETIEVVRERKKSALAWKFFSMENDERAKCNVCHVFISFKGGSTGNLLRHLKTKHTDLDLTPPVKKEDPESEEIKEDNSFDVAENKELAKFVQLLNPRFKLRENPVPRLNEKEVPKRLRKRGAAMSFFDAISAESGICQLCGASVSLKNGSKAPFLRHLKAKHPEMDILLVTPSGNGDAAVTDNGICTDSIENISIDVDEQENSVKQDKSSRKMRKRGLVWNHFVPLGDEKAKCIVCPAVISYKRGSTSNLLRHMKKKHPEVDVHDESRMKAEEIIEIRSSDEETDAFDSTLSSGRPPRKKLRKRGRVWNHFTPVAKDRAKCCICGLIVAYPKGSTTNLLRHMKKRHSSIDLSKEKPFNKYLSLPAEASKKDGREAAATTAATASSPSNSVSYRVPPTECDANSGEAVAASSTAAADAGGEKVNAIYRRSEIIFRKHFDKFLNRPVSVTKSKLFDEQLAKMIVKQYCPFTIVESEDFRKFVHTVNPCYSLPSRKTISSRLIPELYEKCVVKVREHLQPIRHMTATTNSWTLSNNERYIAVTVHFIDGDCAYQSYLLDCFHYKEEDSAETLAEAIAAILTEWNVGDKVNAVVSDDAANVTAAIGLRAWSRVPCFASMLNQVVQAGLLEVQHTHQKVRIVVEHVKKNPAAGRKLAAALKELELPAARPRPDDPKRWQTTYAMFAQLLACRQALVQLDAYVESLPMLAEHEWLLLERVCAVLKPLLDIANEVSEKNITVSKVIPVSRCIGNYLKKMQAADEQQLQQLSRALGRMTEEMAAHFGRVEDDSLLAEATFLDPRFKNQAFASAQSVSNTYASILRLASTATEEAAAFDAAASRQTGAFGDCDIWEEFDSQVNHLTGMSNPEIAAAAEIDSYLAETLLSRAADPLAWWKDRKSLYPRLFNVMKQRLCIAATAVSKNFTNGGQLVYEKRNKLSSSKVSMVLFLNHNL